MNNCTIAYCDRTARSTGAAYCEGHYYQSRRGRPFAPLRKTRAHEPVGQCQVGGCEAEAVSHSTPMCSKHDMRFKRHGDPHALKWTRRTGTANTSWVGDNVGYTGAHDRVRNALGKATKFECVQCSSQAKHWAYDHADIDEKQSKFGPYSTKIEHYQPMCVPCHKNFDLARLAA